MQILRETIYAKEPAQDPCSYHSHRFFRYISNTIFSSNLKYLRVYVPIPKSKHDGKWWWSGQNFSLKIYARWVFCASQKYLFCNINSCTDSKQLDHKKVVSCFTPSFVSASLAVVDIHSNLKPVFSSNQQRSHQSGHKWKRKA